MALSNNSIIAIAVVAIVVIGGAGAAVVFLNNGGDGKAGFPSEGVTVTTFVDYNGNSAELKFNEIPSRVVCGCNTALNLLLYLGLEERIVGCYYNEEPIWDGVKDEYNKLVTRIGEVDAEGSKNISKNIQSDVLLSWQPDLVIGWVSWTDEGLGSEKFWNDNGCNVMSLNTMTSSAFRTVSMMKTDYDNIGKIFNVSEKTTKLYNDTVDTINNITLNLSGKGTIYYALVDGSVNTEKGTVWTYKNSNFIASVLNSMGLKNAFPDGGTVSLATVYEAIGTTDIDVIFYITYGSVTYEKSVASWKADADLSKCAAIKNNNTYNMLLSCSYGSTPQLLDSMNTVYDVVEKILSAKA
ncbi:MAG: ABC transporter substrate-binding protein [archaeon]|nr:ABC transporter substrate-binding protein [archaeon]